MAPTLSFTAEEAWAVFAGAEAYAASDETIFTQTYWELPVVADAAALLEKYTALRAVRTDVAKELEELRGSGAIGSSLQAELTIKAAPEKYKLLASLDDDLRFLFITSQAEAARSGDRSRRSRSRSPRRRRRSASAAGTTAPTSAPTPSHEGLCGRCVSNLFGAGEKRAFV